MRVGFTLLSATMLSFCYGQNLGIGTNTPAVPLHIKNNGPELLRVQGIDPYLSFFNDGGIGKGFMQSHGDNLNIGTYLGNSTGLIQFFNNNNLNMVIHPNSNVGIGTNGPSFKLTVQTEGSAYGVVHRNADVIVGTWVGINSGMNGGWYGTYTNHALNFFTNNGGPQMTLLPSGNVGIGTINPLGRLHINSGGNALTLSGNSPYIYYLDAGGIAKGFLWNKGGNNMDLGTEVGNNLGEVKLTIRGYEALTVQDDGRVRVGTLASIHSSIFSMLPAFTSFGPLCIKDNYDPPADEWTFTSSSFAMGNLYLHKNGDLKSTVNNDGDWNSFSDISLKESLEPFKSVTEDIKKLRVLTYHFKSNRNEKRSFGLIAQNVVEYFPEIVSEIIEKDGKHLLAICYAKTGVLAIKAIQEQQEIIENQEKRIDGQQEIIKVQQKRIDELEKRFLKLENKLK